MKNIQDKMDYASTLQIKIREINPHIVCSLCAGYFIDATTIIECLHTFCKSCLVKYLQSSKYCPTCNTKIHETHPLSNIRLDRTLQDIVQNIVPGLCESERKNKIEFYTSRGLPVPFTGNNDDAQSDDEENHGKDKTTTDFSNSKSSYRDDEQITLSIGVDSMQKSYEDFTVPALQRKYLRCSVRAKCGHLIKLLKKLIIPPEGYEINVKCNGVLVPLDKTMKFVWLAHWRQQKQPMDLSYLFEKIN